MDPAQACASHGWSIITSASTNSQFAGVLAGFVFTGIVMLFAMRGGRYTQALAVLSPTFIVLGFDSYLFSHVTGSGNDGECARVWTDGMFASGMLGVGAAGVVSSICWLLAAHLDTHAEQPLPADASTGQTITDQQPELAQPDPAIVNLPRIAAGMIYGVTVGICLLLAMTADRYLRLVSDDAPRMLWLWGVWTVPVAVLLGLAVLVLARWRRRARHPHAAENKTRTSRVRSLTVVVYGMLAYGLLTPVLAGVIASVGDHWWQDPGPQIVMPAVLVELVFATLLLVALVLAAPPMPPPAARRHKPNGSPDRNGLPVPTQPDPAGADVGAAVDDHPGPRAQSETA